VAGSEEWIVLELNARSEGEDPTIVRNSIQKSVPKTEVFLPVIVTNIGDDSIVHCLVEGYAFVRRGDYPDSAFMRLEMTRYVQAVLSEPGTYGRHRRLSVVKTIDIEKMRQQIASQVHQGIGIGDKVRITTGPYRNIEATVIEEIPETKTVQVFVKLRSKESIVTIPRSGLLVLERSPISSFLSRLTSLRSWLRQSRPVILWGGGVQPLQTLFDRYNQVATWTKKGNHLFSVVSFVQGRHDAMVASMQATHAKLKRLMGLSRKFHPLYAFIQSYYGDRASAMFNDIQSHFMTLAWLEDIEERLKVLSNEIDTLGPLVSKGRNGDHYVVQNVLVDGHNLLFRCFHAPGMAELQDSKGRPTGAILGMLRSLGSLRKRFPDARLWVAWDGTSRRRKKVFQEYKANRPSRVKDESVFDQMAYIGRVLPTVGIRQLINVEEEADDILATAVRQELSGQNNLIFSTDRDMLQLVSATTKVLIPSTGIRKEILFDEATLEEHYGVPVSKFLQLRAFYGDTSDNIPGVPRVPKKILCSLVQAYGGVEAVYKSGLTGLSKGQYERLRASEPQVKINLALMALVNVPVSVTDPDVDPEVATSLLREVDINPSILDAFFGTKSEATDDA
jgi:5'-3' exonuclease/transcription antitermination factor NusG